MCKDNPLSADKVEEALDELAACGPQLGRPLVDRIHGSKIHNLKELRPRVPGNAEVRLLLSQENQISDLIAFLAALDSEPFLEAFGLPGTHCYVEREELLGKGSGRADLIVRDESGPMALLEIKVGATQHGDQFARSWAPQRGSWGVTVCATDSRTCLVSGIGSPAEVTRKCRRAVV